MNFFPRQFTVRRRRILRCLRFVTESSLQPLRCAPELLRTRFCCLVLRVEFQYGLRIVSCSVGGIGLFLCRFVQTFYVVVVRDDPRGNRRHNQRDASGRNRGFCRRGKSRISERLRCVRKRCRVLRRSFRYAPIVADHADQVHHAAANSANGFTDVSDGLDDAAKVQRED